MEKDALLQRKKFAINKPYTIHDIVALSNYVSNKCSVDQISPETF